MTDEEIGSLRHTDLAAWHRAVDPSYAEREAERHERAMQTTNYDELLARLDHEFTVSETMPTSVYSARREAIVEQRRLEARHAETPRPPAPKPAAAGLTKKQVESMIQALVGVIRDHVKIPLQRRIEELEKLFKGSATRADVEEIQKLKARIEPLEAMASRLATVETRCGATSLALGRANPQGAEELDALLSRVKALEERPVMHYHGVWLEDKIYRVGDCVTRSGSMWHGWKDHTKDKPGTSSAWQLTSKSGQKDAR